MTESIESILSQLRKVRRNARGWNACCPAHDDKSPSMLVWIKDGQVMFHCSTGCHWTQIKAALGINPGHRVQPSRQAEKTWAEPKLDFAAIIRRWQRGTMPEHYQQLSADLGVSTDAVLLLGAAWAWKQSAWAFPMSNASGNHTGIRFRNRDGDKWALRGSRAGLFIPMALTGDGPLVIVEGPTDTAAVIDLGFDVVGRPSCNDGNAILTQLCRDSRRDVVILGNRDRAIERPDGSKLYPGQDGAEKLADDLVGVCQSVRIIYPLAGKDARQWLTAGATHDVVASVIRNARPWQKRRKEGVK